MAKQGKNPYVQIHEISKTSTLFSSIQGVLEWDQETYMPADAIAFRSLQIEQMASLVHKHRTSSHFAKALGKLIDIETGELIEAASLTAPQIAALREWRRDYCKAKKLPNSFIKTFAKTASNAQHAWAEAKRNNKFSHFSPHLEKIVTLSRKRADLLGFKEHPYDALLDLYEPEMTTAILTPLFAKLKLSLTTLLKSITAVPEVSFPFLHSYCAPDKQMEFGKFLLHAMGFNDATSRLDLTGHPFCTGLHPKDTRMTTRIHPENVFSNIFSVIHEGGHGLYNMGLPPEQYGSPLCEPISLGIDESQSRWWETLIGRSLPFWEHFFPHLQRFFPEVMDNVRLEDFYRAINIVKPSLIRVEADEVTYSLHVIVRFEIEKALIEGSLKVKEIPEAWNEKMRTYLGISPPSDSVGCLQDIHWSMGGLGYFPTYTLGTLYACQFFAVFEKEHPNWKAQVAKGDLSFIRNWLNENIHQYGRQFTPAGLVQHITKKPLNDEAFIQYLEKKYRPLYRIS